MSPTLVNWFWGPVTFTIILAISFPKNGYFCFQSSGGQLSFRQFELGNDFGGLQLDSFFIVEMLSWSIFHLILARYIFGPVHHHFAPLFGRIKSRFTNFPFASWAQIQKSTKYYIQWREKQWKTHSAGFLTSRCYPICQAFKLSHSDWAVIVQYNPGRFGILINHY